MKTKIYLVRHTETLGNIQNRLVGRVDYDITERGYEYIDKLTARLKNIKFDAVYSSVAKRAIKTVEPLAKLNNCEINISENLCEMNFGDYDGLTWAEVENINPNIIKVRDEDWVIKDIPNQEDVENVAIRMDKYIREIAQKELGKTILIASHGIAIEVFLRNITGEYFSTKKLGYSQKYTALNILEFEDNKFSIITKADVDYVK
jgi:broad specificity phosphatase PhoE